MFKSKYSNFLTVVLIIAIIAIIVVTTVLFVNVYKKYKNNKEAAEAISKFQNNIETNTNTDNNNTGQNLIDQNIVTPSTNTNTTGEGTRKVTYYNNFVMLGYIEIPSINIKYPILEKETVASLEKAVAVRYPDIEITLVTCTNDNNARTIVKAKV